MTSKPAAAPAQNAEDVGRTARRAHAADRARVVVFGASHWHVPLYRDAMLRRHHVVAVQDARPERVDAADAWGVAIDTDVDVVLDTADIDLAYVFSPHDEMAALCRKLIVRGIPFVVEKPLGANLAELLEVAAAARQAGVPATVPLVQRGAPIDTWLRRVGTIRYERMSFIAGPPERYRHNGSPWMLEPTRAGGGALINLGPHFVDLALRHLGPSTSTVQTRSRVLHDEAVEDHATMVLTAENGGEAIVEVGYAFPRSPLKRYCSFSAAGDDGFASIDTDGTARFTSRDGESEEATIDVDSDPLYDGFVEDVANGIAGGFRDLPSLEDLVAAMTLIWDSRHKEDGVQ